MLLRFDPFRELDRASEQLWGRQPAVPMDAVRRDGAVEIRFDLPGVDPDAIELTVERNVLSLRAERRTERREGEEWLAAERRQGVFSRQVFLGDTLDANRLEASYDNGVLRLTIPVAEAAKPRRVAIGHDSGNTGRAVEATSTEATA